MSNEQGRKQVASAFDTAEKCKMNSDAIWELVQ